MFLHHSNIHRAGALDFTAHASAHKLSEDFMGTEHNDYKADRIRLEQSLDRRMKGNAVYEAAAHRWRDAEAVTVHQDGADFEVIFNYGGEAPSRIAMQYEFPVEDWDMTAAKAARAWFIEEFGKKYPGFIPVFDI